MSYDLDELISGMTERDRARSAEVLDGAARYVETYGLWQGDYYPGARSESETAQGDGGQWWARGAPCCSMGAIMSAEHGFGQWRAAEMLTTSTCADMVLAEFLGDNDIPEWNDTPGRTAAEVAQAMRDAATKVRPDAMRSTP